MRSQPTDPVTFDEIDRVRAYTGPPRLDGARPIYCRPCGVRVVGVWPAVFADGRTVGCSKCRQPLVATLVPPKYGGLVGPTGSAVLHIAHGTRPVRCEPEDEPASEVR